MAGSVIVVTGAAGQLGKAVIDRLLADRATVAGIDAMPYERQGILALGNVDLTDPAAAKAAVATIRQRLGAISGLANIAGGFRWETLTDGDVATWDLLYRLNVQTSVVMSQAELQTHEATSLSIVNVGAAAAARASA